MQEVPDCVLASSNSEGIPDLDLSRQGDVLDYPRLWWSVARKTDLNLLGIPRGWTAFATHYHRYYDLDLLSHQVDLAREVAATDLIKFAVFAHNKEVERFCQREGLIYCGEDWSARDIAKKKKALAASEKKIKIEEVQPRAIGLEAWL